MSSPSNSAFECYWQGSKILRVSYGVVQGVAVLAVALCAAPWAVKVLGVLGCIGHALWVLPRQVWYSHPSAWRGLRHGPDGWALWSPQSDWQSMQLMPDSMALPWLIILRYRLPGHWFTRSLCLPPDALSADVHRRLRVRLRFSRHRWAEPK